MSSISSPNKRRDTLELKGDQVMATDEQIRQHCPELFGATFYLERISKALQDLKLRPRAVFKSHLDEESQQKLEVCVTHLTEAIEKTISEIPFDFTVHQESDEEGELPVARERSFAVAVSNAEALLKSVKQPLENLKVLHDLSSLIDTLEKRIEDLKESLANPSSREKNSIERSEIEIRVIEDELNDFNEFEKTGKPTAFQRNQKKQLKDNLEKHRGIIRKIHAKTRKKKERIDFTQETLDQVVQIFTEFLAQYNPETSADFSAELNLTKELQDNRIHSSYVSAELLKTLQIKRKGSYTAYYPEVESRQKWDERKLMLGRFRDRFKKWAAPIAIVLALGGGVYTFRDRIADFFKPVKPAPASSSYDPYFSDTSSLGKDDYTDLGKDDYTEFKALDVKVPNSEEALAKMDYEERRKLQEQVDEFVEIMDLKARLFKVLAVPAIIDSMNRLDKLDKTHMPKKLRKTIANFEESLNLIEEELEEELGNVHSREHLKKVVAGLAEIMSQNPYLVEKCNEILKDHPLLTLMTGSEAMKLEGLRDETIDSLADAKRNLRKYGSDSMDSILLVYIQESFAEAVKKEFGKNIRINLKLEGENYDTEFVNSIHHRLLDTFDLRNHCAPGLKVVLEIEIGLIFGKSMIVRVPIEPDQVKVNDGALLCDSISNFKDFDLDRLLNQYREGSSELSQIKVRLFERFGDRMIDSDKLHFFVSNPDSNEIRNHLIRYLPQFDIKNIQKNGKNVVHIKPHPDALEAMKILYGEGVRVGLQPYVDGRPSRKMPRNRPFPELFIDQKQFCDSGNYVGLIVLRPDPSNPGQYIYNQTGEGKPDFYSEFCPNEQEYREPIPFQSQRQVFHGDHY